MLKVAATKNFLMNAANVFLSITQVFELTDEQKNEVLRLCLKKLKQAAREHYLRIEKYG